MEIRLTQTVKKGGCAAKLPAGQLRQVLQKLKLPTCPELLVGAENLDDAALWDLGNNQLLVQTLDFFTPIVDDPYDFGAIAAANALSDVYAMGGKPITALSILAFPTQVLPIELIEPLLKGALNTIQEAGAFLVGGHTIDDDTLKLGFSVNGLVDKQKCWKNTDAQAGDVLILTKAIGTGTLTSALKNDKISTEDLKTVIESMKTINRVPELLVGHTVNSATDITGFGLAGHLLQMMRASHASAEIQLSAIPVLPGAQAALEQGILNRAHKTNWDYVKDEVHFQTTHSVQQGLVTDPQTSGGLLLSVPAKESEAVLEKIRSRFAKAAIIGRVVSEAEKRITFC